MDPIRDQLLVLVKRVEASLQTDEDKANIYAVMNRYLDMHVLPLFLKRLPKDQMDTFTQNPESITVDSYIKLLSVPINDPTYYKEIEETMKKAIIDIDTVLKEEGI
jgi:hypothetical protein